MPVRPPSRAGRRGHLGAPLLVPKIAAHYALSATVASQPGDTEGIRTFHRTDYSSLYDVFDLYGSFFDPGL